MSNHPSLPSLSITRRNFFVGAALAGTAGMLPGSLLAATADSTIHPFRIHVQDEAIVDLKRSWTERAYRHLNYFNEVDKGGHFASWEQPELFAVEMRAAFKSLR
jgi:pimeloyl-ACP methyl ester carboxylesterase